MAQSSIQLNTTPPYSGAALVDDVNDALQSLGTDFAGPTDPAAVGGVGPNMTWADTGTLTRKRRNAAGTAWVIEGRLFKNHLPIFAVADIPTSDIEPIYVIGKGVYEWDGVSAYAPALIAYDNTASGLTATDVKGAIDELADEKLDAASAFGVGQTWQNVTGSRTSGVAYTNTTGRPIMLSIYWNAPSSVQVTIGVDGNAADDSGNNVAGEYSTSRAVVPAGSQYAINGSGGFTIGSWRELR